MNSRCLFSSIFFFAASFTAGAQTGLNDTTMVTQLYNTSKTYWSTNRDSAVFYLKQSEELADKLHFKTGKAFATYGYGVVEPVLYKQFQYFTTSLEIFGKLHHAFGIGLNLVKIGDVYLRLGEAEKALDYYRQALAVKKKVSDDGGIALALINIGQYYKNKGMPDTALVYFKESLAYRIKVGSSQGLGYAYSNIADIMLALGHPESALAASDSAIHHFSFTNDVSGKIMTLIIRANTLLKMNRSQEAETVFESICQFPPNSHSLYMVLGAKKFLVDRAKLRGDLRKAVVLQSELIAGNEQLAAQDYRTETQRLANEFEFRVAAQKAQEKRTQEASIISRRNTLENLIIAALVMLVFVILFSGRRKIPETMANGVLFIGLLLLFEFLLVLTDSSVENITGGEPVLKLLSNVVLALMILPVHHLLEKYIQKRILKPVG